MSDTQHLGFSNYETWHVSLLIANERPLYERWYLRSGPFAVANYPESDRVAWLAYRLAKIIPHTKAVNTHVANFDAVNWAEVAEDILAP